MLTPAQEQYLQTIPRDKIAHILPFDPKARETGLDIVKQINLKIPNLDVHFGGSAALGIAGQNDIDINILSVPEEYNTYLPTLIELFGNPAKSNSNLIKWEFQKNNFDIELYLTDRNSPILKEHINTFKLLRDNPELLKQYEQIKLTCNGLPFREYMRKKYEFFNKIVTL